MSLANASTLTAASRQWASRPDDERFVNLFDLHDHTTSQRARSRGKVVSSRGVTAEPAGADHKGLVLRGPEGGVVTPSHFAFGQLANLAGAPAGYLRGLPSELAADCINYGLKVERDVTDVGLLVRREDAGVVSLAAATGPNYGRIWNNDLTAALVNRFGNGLDGDFTIPGEFSKKVEITKANTTLYAGDRDMFVFLADEQNRITLPNRRDGKAGSLARGFFLWNSEVGNSTLGFAMFLFDYACSNRIVWGAQGYKEIRLRHTSAAPDRWLEEVQPVIEAYSSSAASPIEAQLQAAQQKRVDNVEEFLKARKWTSTMIGRSQAAHEDEEGRPMETLWDITVGATAYAKSISHQDTRVGVERAAGKLLDLVAA